MAANPVISKINWRIAILCMTGLTLSMYTFIVGSVKERYPSYEAFCDISETISCTDVLTSEYSKGLGFIPRSCFLRLYEVPNFIFGIIFFIVMLIVALRNTYTSSVAALALGIISILTSVYLAFILYKLKKICILCVSTYVVCTLLTYCCLQKFRIIANVVSQQKTK